MDARVLSADEFGVGSRRRRAIIMGVKNGLPRFPKISHGPRGSKSFVTVAQLFQDLSATDGIIYNHQPELAKLSNEMDRKRLKFIPAGCGIRYEKDEKAYLPKRLHYGIDWKKIRESRFRQTKLQRLGLNEPAPTILTSRTMYYHPTECRYLTCREAAACQSFPNDFVFEGSQTSIFRQIGNAVPPALAYALGQEIKKIEFNKIKIKRRVDADFKKKAFTYSDVTYA